MPLELRWTLEARDQLAAIAEHISIASPVYAEQVVARVSARFEQARMYPESGRMVPEFARREIRELIEPPYRLVYRVGTGYLEVISVLHGRQQFPDSPGPSSSTHTG